MLKPTHPMASSAKSAVLGVSEALEQERPFLVGAGLEAFSR